MTARILTAFVPIIVVSVSLPSRAALYQFTLAGVVSLSDYSNVSVGDPFTIRYLVDAQDMDPNPAHGSYAASNSTFAFPNWTLTTYGTIFPLSVTLNSANGTDRVSYLVIPLNGAYQIDFTFAAGTLGSDGLPLALPLSNATLARFLITDSLVGLHLGGNITSYNSSQVPETTAPGLALLMVAAAVTKRLREGTSAGSIGRGTGKELTLHVSPLDARLAR